MIQGPSAAVATSDPRATDAAAAVLRDGGNAVDAAIVATLVLFVVEPHTCGLGGDAFLIVAGPDRAPHALDGAGAVPAGLEQAALTRDGLDDVPAFGGRSVTVPGAPRLLADALRDHGTLTLAEAVRPAAALAREGFEVHADLAEAIGRTHADLRGDPVLGPLYVPDGEPLGVGARVVNAALADALEGFARSGGDELYGGELAREMVATVRADGGYLSTDDLLGHATRPVEAESTVFCGHRVFELPAPTQGPAVLHALDALGGSVPADEVPWERVVEAVRSGLRATGFVPAPQFAGRPGPNRGADAARGDTTYLATVDRNGLAASLITSVFGEFGSRLGIPALGGALHNRAAMFLMLGRPVTLGKPPHTTIPAVVTGPDGGFRLALGVAGGLVQAQVQVQLLVRLLAERLTPQQAVGAPRFKLTFADELSLEPGHPLQERDAEAVGRPGAPRGFGAAQVVGWHGDVLAAGADPRRGGSVALLD